METIPEQITKLRRKNKNWESIGDGLNIPDIPGETEQGGDGDEGVTGGHEHHHGGQTSRNCAIC